MGDEEKKGEERVKEGKAGIPLTHIILLINFS